MTQQAHMEFNYIYVVQSLQPGDAETGTHLHRDALMKLVADLRQAGGQIDAEVVAVNDLADLFTFLGRVRDEVRDLGRFPILHLEIHGSSDKSGLVLTSGDYVAWEDLVPALTAINFLMKNNLLVTLAVCSGAYLAQILRATRPAPLWGLVGPHDTEYDDVLLAGYKAFYEAFLKELDGRKAIRALRAATEVSGQAKYLFFDAEQTFKKGFRAYIEDKCNPTAVDERVKGIMAKARGVTTLAPEQVALITSNIRNRMLDPRPSFDEYRRIHFMIDDYPENDARFPMTFEEVMAN